MLLFCESLSLNPGEDAEQYPERVAKLFAWQAQTAVHASVYRVVRPAPCRKLSERFLVFCRRRAANRSGRSSRGSAGRAR